MERGGVERRRGQRANVEAPLLIRTAGQAAAAFQQETTKNISLGGAYFEAASGEGFSVHAPIVVSVSIPIAQTRRVPFTRLAGRGRVVRMYELPSQEVGGQKRFGIALEFNDDVTALTASPQSG